MTARIREFLQEPHRRRTLPRGRHRCRARELSVLRQGAARHARLLRREGQPGAGDPPAARRARLVLRRRLDQRDRERARRRLHAGPHLLRQHHQEGERDRRRAQARHHAVRGRLRGRGREGRARRARQPRDLPHPLRRLGLGMAALAQVRLRAGLCGRHPGARAQARPRAVRHLVPCRLAAAQHRGLGPRARLDGGDLPRLRRARHLALAWSISAAASRRNTCARRRSSRATARRSSARCASISATPFRRPSSSRAAAWSAMPA